MSLSKEDIGERLLSLDMSEVELEVVTRELNSYRQRVKIVREREALQKVCNHDWSYEGHGHNDELYECKICQLTKWV